MPMFSDFPGTITPAGGSVAAGPRPLTDLLHDLVGPACAGPFLGAATAPFAQAAICNPASASSGTKRHRFGSAATSCAADGSENEMGNGMLAVVTGASTGIGRELAKLCAREGYDLVVAADEPAIADAAKAFRSFDVDVRSVEADLATMDGVDRVIEATGGREVELLLANAGRGLGHAFVEQDFGDVCRVIDTNVTGTLYLVHTAARQMAARGAGRILFTGSIAGFMPGSFQAVYNATKAFIDSFAIALRNELKDSGVTVTCLEPGATDTRFFERAGMTDTKVGAAEKDDPAEVAKAGFEAMMAGKDQIVTGWRNKLQAAAAHVLPAEMAAEQHRKMAEPGTAPDGGKS